MTTDTKTELGFIHRFLPGADLQGPTLLLLHGTGGSEEDLLPLGRSLLPGANLLSPRGKVLEQGMPRFFRRLAEGIFDQEDLRLRTEELELFISEAAKEYGFDRGKVIAAGYSNGANIAASLLLSQSHSLAGAALFHAMTPFVPETLPDQSGVPIFLSAGRRDPIVPTENTERLVSLLQECSAKVTLQWSSGGHQLINEEIGGAQTWLRNGF